MSNVRTPNRSGEEMKIGICGKMASGKTTMAEALSHHQYFQYTIISMAGEVKRVGRELFGMTKKDRPLLQQIGMKMREIRESVWLDAVILQSKNHDFVVCDDVRFVNEAKNLKDDGWLLIKLDIDEDPQKSRLQSTYGDDWEVHWNNRSGPSEAEVDKIPLDWFDLVIPAANDDSPMDALASFLGW